MPKPIFVFGSNEAGIHGAGAAAHAYKSCGARWGFSYGHMGDSFAIPTKGAVLVKTRVPAADGKYEGYAIGKTLHINNIHDYVKGFQAYAKGHPELTFDVTRIGCGLAGLRDQDVAALFLGSPDNCRFDRAWKEIFESLGFFPDYWGTF